MQQLGDMTFDHHTGSPTFVKGGDWISELNKIRGKLKFFKIKGKEKEIGKGFLKFSLGGKLLKMKLQTENKISK